METQRPASADAWRTWDLWLSQQEAIRFNLARVLRRQQRSGEAAAQLAQFQRVSESHNAVRRLRVQVANRPDDPSLRRELAKTMRLAGLSDPKSGPAATEPAASAPRRAPAGKRP